MMKNLIPLLGLTALLAGYLAIPSGMSATAGKLVAKCGVPPVIFLTDGVVQDSSQFNLIDSKTIESISVTCTDVRHLIFGVDMGRSLILTWTKASPARELTSTMQTIASLQEAHFRQHGTYSRNLAELGWSGTTRVSLCVSGNGLGWKLLVANETGGAALPGGTVTSLNARFSCDVRYPGATEALHWLGGEKW